MRLSLRDEHPPEKLVDSLQTLLIYSLLGLRAGTFFSFHKTSGTLMPQDLSTLTTEAAVTHPHRSLWQGFPTGERLRLPGLLRTA